MKAKMAYSKLLYGDKGFIFSLDALISIILVFTIVSALLITLQQKETLPNIYLSKKGSDIITLIDNNNKIDGLDRTAIMNEVSNLLNNENIEVNITSYNTDLSGKSTIDFNIGGKPDNFVSSGKRFFVVSDSADVNKFGVITYKIWQK